MTVHNAEKMSRQYQRWCDGQIRGKSVAWVDKHKAAHFAYINHAGEHFGDALYVLESVYTTLGKNLSFARVHCKQENVYTRTLVNQIMLVKVMIGRMKGGYSD